MPQLRSVGGGCRLWSAGHSQGNWCPQWLSHRLSPTRAVRPVPGVPEEAHVVTWLVGILPFTSTLLGGLAVFRFQHRLHAVMALAAGVIVATALTDLLPEGIGLAGGGEDAALQVGAAAVIGFLIYAGVEAFIHSGSYEHGHPVAVSPYLPHDHDAPISPARSTLGWIGP